MHTHVLKNYLPFLLKKSKFLSSTYRGSDLVSMHEVGFRNLCFQVLSSDFETGDVEIKF